MNVLEKWFFKTRWIPMLMGCSILIYACGSERQPQPTATLPPPTSIPTIGTDINAVLPGADTENGTLKARALGCITCHVDESNGLLFASGEDLPRISERGSMRINDPAYEGKASTNEEYIIESILLPRAHIIEGWWDDDAMPSNFGDLMTTQDMADILAWLGTFE